MSDELEDERPLAALTSVTWLRQLHADLSANFQKLEKPRKTHGAPHLPPLPGIKGRIVPLHTQSDLVAEGREQKNCVASYTAGVVSGDCYIYRVLHPGRATLCIRRQSDGNWGISELEASCNRKVEPATREFVNAWLAPLTGSEFEIRVTDARGRSQAKGEDAAYQLVHVPAAFDVRQPGAFEQQ